MTRVATLVHQQAQVLKCTHTHSVHIHESNGVSPLFKRLVFMPIPLKGRLLCILKSVLGTNTFNLVFVINVSFLL